MLMKRTAAALVAVFLLLATNGCYTHLKTRTAKLVPEEALIDTTTTWDFDWGWAEPDVYHSTIYYDYYYVPWWDDCSWCDDNESSASGDHSKLLDVSLPGDKIQRREEAYSQPSVQVQPKNDSSNNPSGGVEQPTTPPAQPIVQPTQPSGGNDSTPVKKDPEKKVKRPGRR